MGYLNNQIVTIDAILTKKGRELLAKGDGSFAPTQFALADDEIDYTLYNPQHPSGSSYYGEAIDNMPLLEAFPDEQQVMKHKLITLPRGTAKLPVLDIGYDFITLKQGSQLSITPQTLNYLGNQQTFETSGYTATIGDIRVLSKFIGGNQEQDQANNQIPNSTTGANLSKTISGSQFNLTSTTVNTLFGTQSELTTTLTIVGIDSGARVTVPVTIKQNQ